MEVALRRDLLENFGVRRGQLTLIDRQCVATENATHFVLHTSPTECGSQLAVKDKAVLYKNRVQIHRRVGGSQNVVVAMLDVECASNIFSQRPAEEEGGAMSTVPQPVYEMSLYADDFSHIVLLPAEVAIHSTLHVEAVLVQPQSGIGLMVDRCWLSWQPELSDDSEVVSYGSIITNGCADVSSLQWHGEEAAAEPVADWRLRRFSFSLREFDVSNRTVEMSCELSLCSGVEGRYPGMTRCVLQEDYCLSLRAAAGDDVTHTPAWPGVSKLPAALVVVDEPQQPQLVFPTPTSTTAATAGVPVQHCKPQAIRLIGLDTKMVVIVAFSAFTIGVLLMSAVWLIHTRTGVTRRKQRRARKAADHSVSSTPGSLAPFLIHS